MRFSTEFHDNLEIGEKNLPLTETRRKFAFSLSFQSLNDCKIKLNEPNFNDVKKLN